MFVVQDQEAKLTAFLHHYLLDHAKGRDADSWTQSRCVRKTERERRAR